MGGLGSSQACTDQVHFELQLHHCTLEQQPARSEIIFFQPFALVIFFWLVHLEVACRNSEL